MIAREESAFRSLTLSPGDPPNDPSLSDIPSHFMAEDVLNVYSVDDNAIGPMATEWADDNGVDLAATDDFKVTLMLIDCQLTFCNPDFPLFVTGDTGLGAAEDVVRVIRYIYQNCGVITNIDCTLDTHYRHAIFHPGFWVDSDGNHPNPFSVITADDVRSGKWTVSPAVVWSVARDMSTYSVFRQHIREYTESLDEQGRYPLIIWPYHSRLGNIEHALVPSLYEACEWHAAARGTDVRYEVKGANPLAEHYSAVQTEVSSTSAISTNRNTQLLEQLMESDWVIAAGQAASHCFAWTLRDMLNDDMCEGLAHKLIVLEDGTSSVVTRDPSTGDVIPGTPENPTDFRPMAEDAFDEFRSLGVRFVSTQTPITQISGYGNSA